MLIKRQVKHLSSLLEPSIPFHSLVNMVDSEEITLGKMKTQQLSIKINTLSDTFPQKTSIEDTPPESSPRVKGVDPSTSFLNNLLDISSESTIRQLPRHRYTFPL